LHAGSFCPPAIVSHCELDNTLVGEGCVLRHSKLRSVVLGSNAFIDAGVPMHHRVEFSSVGWIIAVRCL
jgi:ADP-glucose pyrophosphorylase